MSVNMAPPMTSGNQPPASSLSALEAKNITSTAKNTPVANRHSQSGYFQP